MSKKKRTTQTSTSGPSDPAVSQAYSGLLGNIQGILGTPLQLYGGQLVAPLNATQNSAINQVAANTNSAQPGLALASQYAQKAATPLSVTPYSASGVNAYYSPYQSDVINSTQALLNQQNAEQQRSLAGNATAAGAWGGDRAAVAQAALAGQQALAGNQTLAGLEQQGFANAQQQFTTQQQLQLQAEQANAQNAAQAAYGLGSLATAGQNASLSGANALLNAGTLQQQVAQENLNVPYEQYLQQLSYPYQQANFASSLYPGIATGTGWTTTGNATVTQPFNPFSLLKEGGRARLSDGGTQGFSLTQNGPSIWELLEANELARNAGGYEGGSIANSVPNTGSGYVPTATPGNFGNTGGGNMSLAGGSASGGAGSSGGLGLANSPLLWGTSSTPGLFGTTGGLSTGLAKLGSDIGSGVSSALGFLGLEKGGRAHLDDGGDAGTEDPIPQDHVLSDDEVPPGWRGLSDGVGGTLGLAKSAPQPAWSDGTPVSDEGENETGASAPPSGSGGVSLANASGHPIWTAPQQTPDWGSVVLSGLGGLLAHRNLGAGIQAGLQEYQEEMDPHPVLTSAGDEMAVEYGGKGQPPKIFGLGIPTEQALTRQQTGKFQQGELGERQSEIDEKARQDAAENKLRLQQLDQQAATEAKQLRLQSAGEWSVQGVDPQTQRPVMVNNRTGQMRLGEMPMAGKTAEYGQPTTIDVPDGKGGTKSVLAQQNKMTGQWVTADESRTPINGTGIAIDRSAGTLGGGRAAAMMNRVLVDARDATSELENISRLPITSSSGLFGARAGTGDTSLWNSTKDVLANNVTPQEVQDFNASAAGLGRAIAGLETGGLQVNQGLLSQFDRLLLAQGDTQFTKMRKMATIRQYASNALEAFMTNPYAAPAQKKLAEEMIGRMQQAIPWTPNDVTTLESTGRPGETIMDVARNKGLAPSVAMPAPKSRVAGKTTWTNPHGARLLWTGKGWVPQAAQ